MKTLALKLLGGFRSELDEQQLSLPTRKAEALLAFVAMHPREMFSRDRLASLLWGDLPQEQSRQSLRQAIFALRKAIDPDRNGILLIEGDEVGLDPFTIDVDAITFEKLLDEGTTEMTQQALALYRGELLDGFDIGEEKFEEWLRSQRERLKELAIVGYTRVLQDQVAADNDAAAVKTMFDLLAIDPLQEWVHRELIRYYLRNRRREAAIKQYQTITELLRRRLGVEPEEETKRLFLEFTSERAHVPPPAAAPGPKHVLVVEDNVLHRDLVRAILREAGYSVTTAENGAHALIEIGKRNYELLMLDVDLPQMTGFELLATIRGYGIETPAIFFTAKPGEEVEVEGLKLGAADFIRKPIAKQALLTRIERTLNSTGK